MINYKGYTGLVELDSDAGILHGRVLDIKDVITFEGKTVDEVKTAFQDSIDDYLNFCIGIEEEPDKPFSGKLAFRTSPDHHRLIFLAATKAGKSINGWMDEVLTQSAKASIS